MRALIPLAGLLVHALNSAKGSTSLHTNHIETDRFSYNDSLAEREKE